MFLLFCFFKQKTAYEIYYGLVGAEMCIRDSAAVAAGLEYRRLSMAAADAYAAYDRLNRKIVAKEVKP